MMRSTDWQNEWKQDDTRVSHWFAFWPVRIGNDWRWLECVTVEWKCDKVWSTMWGYYYCKWTKVAFLELPKE